MALAVKSPPCCCSSLRSSSLVLLYFNLVVSAYAFLYAVMTLSSPGYMRIFGAQFGYVLFFILLLSTASCLIFSFTIISIYKDLPSLNLLTASVCILLLSVAYSIYLAISWTVDENKEKKYRDVLEEGSADLDGDDRYKYKLGVGMMFTPLMIISYGAVLVGIVFQLYSALILHSFKEDLKQRPVYGLPPAQNNPNINASAPYPPNAQFVSQQCPPQPSQYPVPSFHYPNQPPQYVLPPQNYPQAPPY